MIAVDTSMLVRLLVADDAAQGKRAAELFARAEEAFIAKIVVLETAWVLQSAYGFPAIKWPGRWVAWPACQTSCLKMQSGWLSLLI